MATHQRACGTCVHWKYQENVGVSCSNQDVRYKNHKTYYMKGQDCHIKPGQTVTSSNSKDYIEYQQGVVKLKLQNGQMTISLAATVAFNSKEREKIEKDLSDVFEVVTLASSKIVVDKPDVKATVEI